MHLRADNYLFSEKLPTYILLFGVFLLLSLGVTWVRPTHLPGISWFFIAGFAWLIFLILSWRFVKPFSRMLLWCKWEIPAAYFSIAIFYITILVSGSIGENVVAGTLSMISLIAALAIITIVTKFKPHWTKYINGSIAPLTVIIGAVVSQTGSADKFIVFGFSPIMIIASLLLGVTAWKDGRAEIEKINIDQSSGPNLYR